MTKVLIFLLALYNPWIVDAAREFDIHPQIIRGVMWIESYSDPDAVSCVGARGLMQIMPDTAEYISAMTGMDAAAILSDPHTNIRAGAWLLGLWLHRFNDLDMALAAYNAGAAEIIDCECVPEHLEHYVGKARRAMGWDWPNEICNSVGCVVELD